LGIEPGPQFKMHFERVFRDRADEAVFPGVAATDLRPNPDSAVIGRSVFPDAVSPSLRPRGPGTAPAFEVKFLIDESCARQVAELLGPRMSLDPHADPALGNAYRTTTVYCETPEFDVFRGMGMHKFRKYRLRRYADGPGVFLERKSRRGERVRKRRTAVARADLDRLAGDSTQEWPAAWFQRQVSARRLSPICSVQYVRTAYVGEGDEGPVRLTFDRHLQSAAAESWSPEVPCGGIPFFADQVICEFKFRAALPAIFKSAISELQLVPAKVSKYRRCLEALGLAGMLRDLETPSVPGEPGG
jgi:hypothetical protein